VGGRVTERVVFILIAVEDPRDLVLFRIGQELMSGFGYALASSYIETTHQTPRWPRQTYSDAPSLILWSSCAERI
jgi:hypothetical protein